MPKYHEMMQGSDAWDTIRLGKPTASEFKKIITPEGKTSTQWRGYARLLIAELILKRQVNNAIADSSWMQRGKELEGQAVLEYEAHRNVDTQFIGFVTTDDDKVGCSPDRLVGGDGLLELKCPAPQTQVAYLLDEEVSKEYKPQLQGQLFVTGREWVDIFSYHPELPFNIVRVTRDDVYIRSLESLLERVTDYIAEGVIKIADRLKPIDPQFSPDETSLARVAQYLNH